MDFVEYKTRASEMFGRFIMNQNKLKAEVYNLDPLDFLESQYNPHCPYIHSPPTSEDFNHQNPYHVIKVSTPQIK